MSLPSIDAPSVHRGFLGGRRSRLDPAARARLRRFGFTVGPAFLGGAGFLLWRGVHGTSAALWISGGLVLFLASVRPGALRPLEWAWVGAGQGMTWLNTRFLLGGAFALFLVPLALTLRVMGRDIMGRRPNPGRSSYFEPRRERAFEPAGFERQF